MDKPDNYPTILIGRRPKTLAELYSTKVRWTRGANGRDSYGQDVSEFSSSAVSWCLGGALNLVYGLNTPERSEALGKLCSELSLIGDIILWNDNPGRTFKDVRALVVKAGV